MVIWMADATIRQARKALTHKTGWPDVKRADYNLPEVEMASAVLFNMFGTFEAAIRYALIGMPKEFDGFVSVHGRTYFDEFVASLDRHLKTYSTPEKVMLRESDWVLDTL